MSFRTRTAPFECFLDVQAERLGKRPRMSAAGRISAARVGANQGPEMAHLCRSVVLLRLLRQFRRDLARDAHVWYHSTAFIRTSDQAQWRAQVITQDLRKPSGCADALFRLATLAGRGA